MANQSLLTHTAKTISVDEQYYAPVAALPPYYNVPLSTIYGFIARTDPWPDENNPPVPQQDVRSIKNLFKNIFALKKITSNDIIPVIQRFDWVSGTVYDYYRDDIDMFTTDENGLLLLEFYVKNRYDQVFKCLWNNNGAPSTLEPHFQPGTYNTNNIYQDADGYKWKYIYTIDTGSKVKFMDANWLPVRPAPYSEDPLLSGVGLGSIDVINVTNGGSGYDPGNSAIVVTVTGDGIGAAGTPIVNNGVITDIVVTNPGANYTFANVIISSTTGSGATAIAPASPLFGHGWDPSVDFAPSRVMFVVEFDGSENGLIPTTSTTPTGATTPVGYRQFGIMINPSDYATNPYPANAAVYKTTTDFVVASGFGGFTQDEIVYQGSTLDTATFTATVLSFDTTTNIIHLINTTGNPIINGSVYGNSSKTTRTLLSYSTPNFILFTGSISYIENRSVIYRSADGIEQFKAILSY
jgi:hypothetical protein